MIGTCMNKIGRNVNTAIKHTLSMTQDMLNMNVNWDFAVIAALYHSNSK